MIEHRSLKKYLSWLSLAVFIVVSCLQMASLWNDFIQPFGAKIWDIRGNSAIERSAILHEDKQFAEFITFIREMIPEDARVILPPHSTFHVLSNFGFADYFLMPRELHNCGSTEIEGCVLRMTGARSYFFTAGDFPPPQAAGQVKTFIPFKDGLGVWAPK
jgi:hypothetical protein